MAHLPLHINTFTEMGHRVKFTLVIEAALPNEHPVVIEAAVPVIPDAEDDAGSSDDDCMITKEIPASKLKRTTPNSPAHSENS
jgi:hypothetical protein